LHFKRRSTDLYEAEWRRGSPTAARLIADLEFEFDLLRIKRYMADLERKDERLVEEIGALRARFEAPTRAPESALLPDMRRWWRALAVEAKILWLKARREILAEEWRRCSAIAGDIRFGMRVTGVGSPRE
jgi:hypothetical protein